LAIIDSKRQEKWVENSATRALAVTRDHLDGIQGEYPDIRIVMKFPRIRISRMASADGIRIPVSVVNTGYESIATALFLLSEQTQGDIDLIMSWPSKCRKTGFHSANEKCNACLKISLMILRKWEGPPDITRFLLPTPSSIGITKRAWKGPWARQYDPRCINLDLIQPWLRECENNHYDPCLPDLNLDAQGLPMLLIDVEEWRLVQSTIHTSKYIALSYVWGQVSTLKTTKETIEQFKEPGAFSLCRRDIPQTIRDAMSLTRGLDLR
jgi:hypothetical protein